MSSRRGWPGHTHNGCRATACTRRKKTPQGISSVVGSAQKLFLAPLGCGRLGLSQVGAEPLSGGWSLLGAVVAGDGKPLGRAGYPGRSLR